MSSLFLGDFARYFSWITPDFYFLTHPGPLLTFADEVRTLAY